MNDEPGMQSGRDLIHAGWNVTQAGGDVVGGDKITNNYYPPVPAPQNELERRNRTAMLQKVHDAWVTGVLEQSLRRVVLPNRQANHEDHEAHEAINRVQSTCSHPIDALRVPSSASWLV